jgi:hypothetical protein
MIGGVGIVDEHLVTRLADTVEERVVYLNRVVDRGHGIAEDAIILECLCRVVDGARPVGDGITVATPLVEVDRAGRGLRLDGGDELRCVNTHVAPGHPVAGPEQVVTAGSVLLRAGLTAEVVEYEDVRLVDDAVGHGTRAEHLRLELVGREVVLKDTEHLLAVRVAELDDGDRREVTNDDLGELAVVCRLNPVLEGTLRTGQRHVGELDSGALTGVQLDRRVGGHTPVEHELDCLRARDVRVVRDCRADINEVTGATAFGGGETRHLEVRRLERGRFGELDRVGEYLTGLGTEVTDSGRRASPHNRREQHRPRIGVDGCCGTTGALLIGNGRQRLAVCTGEPGHVTESLGVDGDVVTGTTDTVEDRVVGLDFELHRRCAR